MRRTSPVRCILCVFALIVVCFSLGMMAEALPASAAICGCRADPIVWLSNGVKLTMTVGIAADASQVNLITYTVHAPKGLTARSIVYTGGALHAKERVVMSFDRTSGYSIETRVDLGENGGQRGGDGGGGKHDPHAQRGKLDHLGIPIPLTAMRAQPHDVGRSDPAGVSFYSLSDQVC